MSKSPGLSRILIIDSGGGYGGPGVFLWYLLKYLDRSKFQPFVAFYYSHVSPETTAVQQMGVPTFFLGDSRPFETYLEAKFRSAKSKWPRLHLAIAAMHFSLQLILIGAPRLWKLLRILKKHEIDLILLNNDVHYHLVGALASRLTRIPCICRKAGGIGEGRLFKKLLTRWIDLFIVVSAATLKDQRENNLATKRMVFIAEGVDLERFVPSSADMKLRRELGVPEGKRVVACISRLVEGKGHCELVEAAASIINKNKDVVFLIVGDGPNAISVPFLKTLKDRIRDLSLSPHFIFAGWRTDIPEILSLADIFVHCPTTWIEGLGIAHLEAMAMGKPTVVSRNGGLPDAAVDGVTGFVVPPGDIEKLSSTILQLLNDDALSLRLGHNARKRVEALFDIKKNTKKMEMLLHHYSLKSRFRRRRRAWSRHQRLYGVLREAAK